MKQHASALDSWDGAPGPLCLQVYMWPAKKGQGMSAGPTVAGILRLAGFSAVKSKVRRQSMHGCWS